MANAARPDCDTAVSVEHTAPSERAGLVFNIQRFAVHDGPGVRTTVFLKGCPLACQWCHNPESRSRLTELSVHAARCIQCASCLGVCPHDAVARREDGTYSVDPMQCARCGECVSVCPTGGRELIGDESTVDDVMAAIEKDRVFYDESGGGVTFSGGEPLAQPGFLLALLDACRGRDLHSTVDTCGMATESTLRAVAERVDLFLFDLKLMDDARHVRYTGASNRAILRNLELLAELDADVWIRVPLVPGISDDAANIDAIGAFVTSLERRYPIHLLPYHAIARDKYERCDRDYPLDHIDPLTGGEVAGIAERLRTSGCSVRTGG